MKSFCCTELGGSDMRLTRPMDRPESPRTRLVAMSAGLRPRHFGTPEQRRAHEVLDRVKAGERVPADEVRRALRTLGERA